MGRSRGARRTRRMLGVLVVVASLAALPACGGDGGSSGTPTLKWYVFQEPSGAFQDAASKCTKSAKGAYKVSLVPLPADADQQREQLVRRLAAKDSDIDIIGMDVIWTAEFANAGWIKEWPQDKQSAVTDGRLKPAVQTATYKDKLYAAPLNSNTQLLWYRHDLTKTAPKTWDQMVDAAEQLRSEKRPSYIQAQGQRYEGLVVWFTSLIASAGGTILNEDGTKVTLPTGPTEKALEAMKRYSSSPVAPPNLSTAREDDARLGWEAGDSAFMVNYSFVWPSANQNNPGLAEDMRWAQYPGVDPNKPSKVAIGGINLGVGSYSKHPKEAFDAASCLVQDKNQIVDATKGGLLPVTESLYENPELTKATVDGKDANGKSVKVKAFPYATTVKEALATAVLRPQTPYYNDVALAIARTIHPTTDINPKKDVGRLRDAISTALKGEGLL
jgi:multiple sugar transport system substrate-binding protein